MHKTTIYLDDELRRRIERDARLDGISKAEVIRAALDKYTRPLDGEPLWPASAGIGNSGRSQAESFDEWKSENWNRDW